MKTINESIKFWKLGYKQLAYGAYLQDEGSYGVLSFEGFCNSFQRIVDRHDENIAQEQFHATSNRVD